MPAVGLYLLLTACETGTASPIFLLAWGGRPRLSLVSLAVGAVALLQALRFD